MVFPLPLCPDTNLFEGIGEADSIVLDPHKWLYAPLEAGCTLVKNSQHLIDTYSAHPVYYNFDSTVNESTTNFYEYSFQNSRGFRALKVWMALQQIGKNGYIKTIKRHRTGATFIYGSRQTCGTGSGIAKLKHNHVAVYSYWLYARQRRP